MLWGFFTQLFRLPMLAFARVMANPMGIFVYGILSKWYIMVVLAAAIVTFWVFKGLEKSGVLSDIETTVRGGLMDAQAIAQHCTPKIRHLDKMWDCIQKTSGKDYKESKDAKALRIGLAEDEKKNMEDTKKWSKSSRNQRSEYSNPYDDGS